jgi:hypothetical protein
MRWLVESEGSMIAAYIWWTALAIGVLLHLVVRRT